MRDKAILMILGRENQQNAKSASILNVIFTVF